MLDIKGGTKPVKLVRAGRAAFAQSKQPLGERFWVIREYRLDPHRAGALQVAQETPGDGPALAVVLLL